mgnify:CR=1 FL=1
MTAKQEDLHSALSPCGSGSHVVYAWALNAPELILPEGVGFRVGGPDSEIDWLVLQVHYASVNKIPEEGEKWAYVLLCNLCIQNNYNMNLRFTYY